MTRIFFIILIIIVIIGLNTTIVKADAFEGGKVILNYPDLSFIDNDSKIDITAKAAIVADGDTGEILYAKNMAVKIPLASITKLMSFSVLSDFNLDKDSVIELKKEDLDNLKIYVAPNDKISALNVNGGMFKIKDLFYAGLLKSANDAISALVRSVGFNFYSFAKEMNKKALQFGMSSTQFDEPTGLSVANTGTARDLVLLALNVFNDNFAQEITSKKSYNFNDFSNGKTISFDSTNKLFHLLEGTSYKIIAGKTGYLDESGYNLVVKVQNGKEFIIVVLGSRSDEERFTDTFKLIKWIDSYK